MDISALLILLAGTLWGTLGICSRAFAAAGVSSMQLVIYRAWGTSIVLILFLLIYKKELLRIRLKDLWCFIGTGICSIVFFNYCYFRTIQITSLSTAAILLYTAPAMVVLMSAVLFKEKLNARMIAALLLAFVGCIMNSGVFEKSTPGMFSAEALIIGLLSGFGYALYSIFSRFALERGYHSLTITVYTFLTASVVLIPAADVKLLAGTFYRGDLAAAGVYLVVACTVIAYLVYTLGMSGMDTGKASIIASVEPVVATLVGIFLYHEKMTAVTFTGMILVLAAIVLLNVKKS